MYFFSAQSFILLSWDNMAECCCWVRLHRTSDVLSLGLRNSQDNSYYLYFFGSLFSYCTSTYFWCWMSPGIETSPFQTLSMNLEDPLLIQGRVFVPVRCPNFIYQLSWNINWRGETAHNTTNPLGWGLALFCIQVPVTFILCSNDVQTTSLPIHSVYYQWKGLLMWRGMLGVLYISPV